MEKDVERTGRSLMSVIPTFARREGRSETTDVDMQKFVPRYGLRYAEKTYPSTALSSASRT